MIVAIVVAACLASAVICHLIARRRGLHPAFWGVMGLVFGPLAIPFCLAAKARAN